MLRKIVIHKWRKTKDKVEPVRERLKKEDERWRNIEKAVYCL